jgi:hypothetical protein
MNMSKYATAGVNDYRNQGMRGDVPVLTNAVKPETDIDVALKRLSIACDELALLTTNLEHGLSNVLHPSSDVGKLAQAEGPPPSSALVNKINDTAGFVNIQCNCLREILQRLTV